MSQNALQPGQSLAAANDILLSEWDEVITGFRIGLTGAQGHFGVSGDISIYAPAIASVFPVEILGASRELRAKVVTGQVNHAGTYNTGISSTVAALATLTEQTLITRSDQLVSS